MLARFSDASRFRRFFSILLGALFYPALLLGQGAERPNVVVIMADDLDLGSLDKVIDLGMMPVFEHVFVDGGVDFTNAFVTNSLCCPSRATFLTGQYSHNNGVLSNFPPNGSVTALDDSSTLATWLQEAGYRTAHIGKYLNGYGTLDVNHDGRIDGLDRTYVPPGWDDWQALVDISTYRVYDYTINDNGVLVRYGATEDDYQTDVLARRTVEFISESDQLDDDAPFFTAVMPLAPHVEIFPGTPAGEYGDAWRWTIRAAPRHEGTINLLPPQPPSFNELDVSDKPAWLQQRPRLDRLDYLYLVRQYRDRLESLRALDDLIGAVIAELERTNELERTVLFFTSDNGFLYGEHRLPEKLYAYEEAIRVPLFVRYPGRPAGTRQELVLNNDLAPTIAELAGVAPGLTVDGTSFLPLLGDGSPNGWRERFLVEHWLGRESIFEVPDYRAVRTGPSDPFVGDTLYVVYEETAQTPELYDLNRDPYQLESQHDASSNRARWQQSILRNWLLLLENCLGQTCRALEFHQYPEGSSDDAFGLR